MAQPDLRKEPFSSTLDQSTSLYIPSMDIGLICRMLKVAGSPAGSAANSISMSQFTSFFIMPSRVSIMSARGKLLYFRILAKVTYFGPAGAAESTILIFSASQVDTTCLRDANLPHSPIGIRSMLTASSTLVLKVSGLRFRASIAVWVSLMVSSGVDVWSMFLGYFGEKRSTVSPSTTALPRP